MLRTIAFVVVAVVVAPLRSAFACQCASEGPAYNLAAAQAQSTLIFEGRVESLGPHSGTLEGAPVQLADVKAHRGTLSSEELRLTNGDECSSQQLEKGKRYLFYLGKASVLHINACSRVIAFPEADKEVTALAGATGAPSAAGPPDDPSQPTPPPPTLEPEDANARDERATGGAPTVPSDSGGCASCQAGGEGRDPRLYGGVALAMIVGVATRSLRRRRTATQTGGSGALRRDKPGLDAAGKST
ncbi:MAG: hypothetical protein HOW73_42895 [Polyangiaceae bacterium]|nr:hypothetical protein [Polyangiaceae bacterium]